MSVGVFVYTDWVTRYPEFTVVSSPTAQAYWNEATIYWNNTSNRVSLVSTQTLLLYMLTAHIAALYSQSQNDPSPGSAQDANTPVGRISNASEGSVSAAFQYDSTNPEQWFAQTKYGASFWAATRQYRTARYVRGALQPGGLSRTPFGGRPY